MANRDWGNYDSDPERNRRIREILDNQRDSGNFVPSMERYSPDFRSMRWKLLFSHENEPDFGMIKDLVREDRNYSFLEEAGKGYFMEEFKLLRGYGVLTPYIDWDTDSLEEIRERYLGIRDRLREYFESAKSEDG
jgi:hypothetical protein